MISLQMAVAKHFIRNYTATANKEYTSDTEFGYTVEVWEWISDFLPHFIVDVITYGVSFVSIWVG